MSRIKGTIMLKDREIPLKFTCLEMRDIQLEIATPLSLAISTVLGRAPGENKGTGSGDHLAAAAKMIRIMGNAGLEESGQEPDLTDKGVMRALKPAELAEIITECVDVISEALGTEEKEEPEAVPTAK